MKRKRKRPPMSRASRINLAAAIIAVSGAICAASLAPRNNASGVRTTSTVGVDEAVRVVSLEDGGRALLDASNSRVRLEPFQRIVSASTVSDWLLLELCENERVLAVTERSLASAPWRHRFVGKASVASLGQLETLISMKPDLLLVDSFGDPRRVARLREQGIAVFDLGQMRGLDTLIPTVLRVGELCGHAERGRRLARRIRHNTLALARDIPDDERPVALYLSPYGDKLFGGTRGTAYHDMLVYAGLRDAAARAYRDFPEYNAEQVLSLDPELVVTRAGMADILCRHTGLEALRACTKPGAIVELEPFSIDDPGLGLIESIESLYHAVHGDGSSDGSSGYGSKR